MDLDNEPTCIGCQDCRDQNAPFVKLKSWNLSPTLAEHKNWKQKIQFSDERERERGDRGLELCACVVVDIPIQNRQHTCSFIPRHYWWDAACASFRSLLVSNLCVFWFVLFFFDRIFPLTKSIIKLFPGWMILKSTSSLERDGDSFGARTADSQVTAIFSLFPPFVYLVFWSSSSSLFFLSFSLTSIKYIEIVGA